MKHKIDYVCVSGEAITPYLQPLAALRIGVFREWPYLYQGDAAYEAEYLQVYVRSPRSLLVMAMMKGQILGASTALPLADESPAFQAPFIAAGWDPAQVFYFGESVLVPAWRGLGIGHQFFNYREAHARRCGGFSHTSFAAVLREAEDPRRPINYRSHDVFWHKRGYQPSGQLQMRLGWPEWPEGHTTEKSLQFWLRPLEA